MAKIAFNYGYVAPEAIIPFRPAMRISLQNGEYNGLNMQKND
jgi:hypothetical protein